VKKRFQSSPFKCNLQRYTAASAFASHTFNAVVLAKNNSSTDEDKSTFVVAFPPTLTPNGYFGLLIRRAPEVGGGWTSRMQL
jgi:hypothetical protein